MSPRREGEAQPQAQACVRTERFHFTVVHPYTHEQQHQVLTTKCRVPLPSLEALDPTGLDALSILFSALGMQQSERHCSNQMATPHPGWPSPYRHSASLALQASFNEQIKHIIRKLHAVFVQPQQQQDKSLGGDVEHEMIFARPIDNIPDFDRLVTRSGHNLGPVRGKHDRRDAVAVGVGLLAQQLQFACQTDKPAGVSFGQGGAIRGLRGAPKSQTLIVLSSDPDTILVPSGENTTDVILLLWAFVFSLSISSLPARQANKR